MRAARGMCKLQILRSGQTDKTGQLGPAYAKSMPKTAQPTQRAGVTRQSLAGLPRISPTSLAPVSVAALLT